MEYKKRFTIKAFEQKGDRPLELSRPGNMKSHPWSYMFDIHRPPTQMLVHPMSHSYGEHTSA